MSNYSTLKAAISAVIKENNNHEITGQVLQTTLLAMVDSLAGGYLFKGIATPATVVGTPDENVFYIGGGGLYSNFGATPVNVPDGCIGIFTYNGSFENHIIPTGGVFDISAYNAVGGTPATYADLTAALGTNGANIPDYLRKGGMSVKFIQGNAPSSNNNYVQFRCIADEFTTDVTKWQGVDAEPTAGSKNLVESGGVDLAFARFGIEKYLDTTIATGQNAVQYTFKAGYQYTIERLSGNTVDYGSFYLSKDGTNAGGDNRVQTIASPVVWSNQKVTFIAEEDALGINGFWAEGALKLKISGGIINNIKTSIKNVNTNVKNKAAIPYFTDASFPAFSFAGGSLNITLPSALMRLYSDDGKIVEFDLTELQSRSFDVFSMRKLVYDFDNNTISVEDIIRAGNFYVLLSVCGDPTAKGAVDGGLLGYYLAWLKYEYDASIIDINSNIDRLGLEKELNTTITSGQNAVQYSFKTGYQYTIEKLSGNTVDFGSFYLSKDGTANSAESNRVQTIANPVTWINNKVVFIAEADALGINGYWAEGTLKLKISGGIIDGVKDEIKQVNTSVKNKSAFVYFTEAKFPTFSFNVDILNLTLPSATMRLYTDDGIAVSFDTSTLQTREFSLSTMQKLVYDFDNNTISVKQANATGNFYVLLSVGGSARDKGSIDGGLLGYYLAWLRYDFESRISSNTKQIEFVKGRKFDSDSVKLYADFACIFFSDIHAGNVNMQRIVDYAESLGENIDCIINGGDTVSNLLGNGLSWYNAIVDECSVPILNTAGNHDCWSDGWVWANQTDVYNLITAKVKEQVPSIVQPINAATLGLNYYYNDFGNIRVISLLAMQDGNDNLYFDNAQLTWFTDVLEDARTSYKYYKVSKYAVEEYTLQSGDVVAGTYPHVALLNNPSVANGIYQVPMSVIVFTHAPFAKDEAIRVSEKLCSWLDYRVGCRAKDINFDDLKVNDTAVAAVNTYIQNGGSFICWLTGHTHTDNLLTNENYDGQFMLNILSANYSKKKDGVVITNQSNDMFDSFNYIGIDLKSGQLKCQRIGWNEDSSLRVRKAWCYDYVNKELLSEN